MDKFKKHFKFWEIFRYGLVTATSYLVLYAGTILLVEWAGWQPRIAYFFLITIIYVGVYISYTKFVFRESFSRQTFKRFVVILAITWALNNVFFTLLNHWLGIQYLITMILNTVIFGAVRFTIQRLYVFTDKQS